MIRVDFVLVLLLSLGGKRVGENQTIVPQVATCARPRMVREEVGVRLTKPRLESAIGCPIGARNRPTRIRFLTGGI
jgi:hypothetical protein